VRYVLVASVRAATCKHEVVRMLVIGCGSLSSHALANKSVTYPTDETQFRDQVSQVREEPDAHTSDLTAFRPEKSCGYV